MALDIELCLQSLRDTDRHGCIGAFLSGDTAGDPCQRPAAVTPMTVTGHFHSPCSTHSRDRLREDPRADRGNYKCEQHNCYNCGYTTQLESLTQVS